MQWCNDLNQKLITAINTLDRSTLADNLIASHQVDYLTLARIPAEAIENDQEHLVAIKYSIPSLILLKL